MRPPDPSSSRAPSEPTESLIRAFGEATIEVGDVGYYWWLNLETGEYERICIWNAAFVVNPASDLDPAVVLVEDRVIL